MEPEKGLLPLAVSASPGIGGVSARFSIVPDELAAQTEALGQAVIHLIITPPSEQKEAAEVFSHRLEEVAHSFDLICQDASCSAQSMSVAMAEVMRKNIEQAMRFVDDFANAKGPGDAIGLQFAFIAAQVQLFTGQLRAMQQEFAKLFLLSASVDKTQGLAKLPSR